MAKQIFKVVALLLTLLLTLTGCSMIEVDKEMDDAEVIIKVNDVEMVKKDVMEMYDNYAANLAYQYKMYASFGYPVSMPKEDELKQMIADEIVMQEICRQKAEELGLDKLTDAEKAEVEKNAQKKYDDAYAQVKLNVKTDGMSDDEITAAADKYMAESKLNIERFTENETELFVQNKLDEYIYKDLSVTDDEVQAEYEKRVADDKAAYESDAAAIDKKLSNGADVYYYPEGYRHVKHILIKFLEDDAKAMNELNMQISDIQKEIDSFGKGSEAAAPADAENAEAAAEPTAAPTEAPTADPAATPVPTMDPELPSKLQDLQAQLEAKKQAARANIQAKVDEVYQKAIAGEDFDGLISEYGEDPGMTVEPSKTYGYIIGENITRYETSFHAASMALANVGDISEPVEGSKGMHIIKYDSEIPAGDAELTETMKTEIRDALMAEKKQAEKTAKQDEWKKASKVEVNLKEMVRYD